MFLLEITDQFSYFVIQTFDERMVQSIDYFLGIVRVPGLQQHTHGTEFLLLQVTAQDWSYICCNVVGSLTFGHPDKPF